MRDRGLVGVSVRPIGAGERERFDGGLDEHHWLGRRLVGETMRYVAVDGSGEWVALVGFGAAALACRPRDAYVGWSDEQHFRRLRYVTCFARPLRRDATAILAATFDHPVLVGERIPVLDLNGFNFEGEGGLLARLEEITDLDQSFGEGRNFSHGTSPRVRPDTVGLPLAQTSTCSFDIGLEVGSSASDEAGVSAAVNVDALPGTSIVIVVPVRRAECSQGLRLRHRRGLLARALLPPRPPRVGVWRNDEASWNPRRPEASIGSTAFPPPQNNAFPIARERHLSARDHTNDRSRLARSVATCLIRFLSGRQLTLGWLTACGPWRPRRRRRSIGRERWRCLGT